MTAILEEKDRNIVPRWRDFTTTVELQELTQPVSRRKPLDRVREQNIEVQHIAFEENKSLSFAGDLISAALVSGNSTVANSAAEFVLNEGAENSSEALLTLAKRILGNPKLPTFELVSATVGSGQHTSSRQIAELRCSLRNAPHDAIQWMDLAYLFAINGLNAKAERAARIAHKIAPSNRFILRSSARCFLHLQDFKEAHRIVRRSPNISNDPWIAAAEIAVASAAGYPPFSVREGRGMMSSDRFPNHDLSELASALSTLDLKSGSIGKARKWLRQSLRAPNENSLAQAKWISRGIFGVPMDVKVADYVVPRPYEARAFEAFVKGDWSLSAKCAVSWFEDQPFSSRPAEFASYIIGSLIEDHWESERIVKRGLIASPDDFGLNVNLAFDYVSTRRLIEAKAQLVKCRQLQGPEWASAVILANYGLIAYQEKDPVAGRIFYGEAVTEAENLKDKKTLLSALVYFARAEMEYDLENADNYLRRAEALAKDQHKADTERLINLAKDKRNAILGRNLSFPIK